MPTLVHITDEKNGARIKRSGIALGKPRRAIFFMPVGGSSTCRRRSAGATSGCPACLPRGSIRSRSIRERYDPESKPVAYETLVRSLTESSDLDTLIESPWSLRYKLRKTDPAFLQRLMNIDDMELQEHLARTLGHFKHEESKRMLLVLCAHECADVKETAAESLFRLYRHEADALLFPFRSDPVIGKVIESHQPCSDRS